MANLVKCHELNMSEALHEKHITYTLSLHLRLALYDIHFFA